MAHLSSASLWAEISAEASKAYAAGIRFFVVCENQRGEWFALHADDQGHAGLLARVWVEKLGLRGASCWRLFPWGPAPEAFFSYFEQVGDDLLDPDGEAIEGSCVVINQRSLAH